MECCPEPERVHPELMEQLRAIRVQNLISNALSKQGGYRVSVVDAPDEQPGSLHLALIPKTMFHGKAPSVEQQAKMWEATLTSLGIVNPEMEKTDKGIILKAETVASVALWLFRQPKHDQEQLTLATNTFGLVFSKAVSASKARSAA